VVEGETGLTMDGQPVRNSAFRIWYAQAPPFKARMSISGGQALSVDHVCDGAAQWTWYPATKTYARIEAAQIGPCAYPLNEWPALPVTLRSPVVVGTDRVATKEGSRECTLVRGEFQPQEGDASARTLCIDAVRKPILRYDIERTTPRGRSVESMTFASIQRDEATAAAVLEFHPSTDAKPVTGFTAPMTIWHPQPSSTGEAGEAHPEGRAVVSLTIAPEGFGQDITVVESAGRALDEKAVEAVRKWQWQPAMKDGKPVSVTVKIEVNFRQMERQH
jgi:TonB family protein